MNSSKEIHIFFIFDAMSNDKGKREKKRIKIRNKVSKKKLRRYRKWKEAGHQIFTTFIILFLLSAAYLLIWGLIIEPNLPRHIYGPGDFRESILLLFSLLIVAISYLAIMLIKYKPLDFEWWDNILLFSSVKFDLDKYAALKRLGIKYHHRKKKTKKTKHIHAHKSITEE